MYVCMYVCMYVLYVCMYLRMYACTYVCMYICMYVCMYVFGATVRERRHLCSERVHAWVSIGDVYWTDRRD